MLKKSKKLISTLLTLAIVISLFAAMPPAARAAAVTINVGNLGASNVSSAAGEDLWEYNAAIRVLSLGTKSGSGDQRNGKYTLTGANNDIRVVSIVDGTGSITLNNADITAQTGTALSCTYQTSITLSGTNRLTTASGPGLYLYYSATINGSGSLTLTGDTGILLGTTLNVGADLNVAGAVTVNAISTTTVANTGAINCNTGNHTVSVVGGAKLNATGVHYGLFNFFTDTITLDVNGEASFTATTSANTGTGIYSNGNVTITGAGKVTAKGYTGILIPSTKALSIDNCDVTAEGTNYNAISAGFSMNDFARLTMKNGGDSQESHFITCSTPSSTRIWKVTGALFSGAAANNPIAVVIGAKSTAAIERVVLPTGAIDISIFGDTNANSPVGHDKWEYNGTTRVLTLGRSGVSSQSNGKYTLTGTNDNIRIVSEVDSTGSVTLSNAHIETNTGPAFSCFFQSAVTLSGSNSLTAHSTASSGLYLYNPTTINGSGSLTVTTYVVSGIVLGSSQGVGANLNVSGSVNISVDSYYGGATSAGIDCSTNGNHTISVSNSAKFNVSGYNYGLFSSLNGNITLDVNGEASFTATAPDNTARGIYTNGNLNITGAGKITAKGNVGLMVANSMTLSIDNCDLTAEGTGSPAISMSGTLRMNDFARLTMKNGAAYQESHTITCSTPSSTRVWKVTNALSSGSPSGNPISLVIGAYSTVIVERVVPSPYVCQIGSTDYLSLTDAIAAVPTGGSTATVIKLLANINHNGQITLNNKKISFDLNGNNLTLGNTAGESLVLNNSNVGYTGYGSFKILANGGSETKGILITGGTCTVSVDALEVSGEETTGISSTGGTLDFTGDITAKSDAEWIYLVNAGSAGPGLIGGSLTITGNLTATSPHCSGLIASSEARITVNGNITVSVNVITASEPKTHVTVNGNVVSTSTTGSGCLTAMYGAVITVSGSVTSECSGSTGVALVAYGSGSVITVGGTLTAGIARIANLVDGGKIVLNGAIPSNAAVYFGSGADVPLTPANQDAVQSQPGYTTYTKGSPASIVWVKIATYKQGDINRDGDVNVLDLSILLANFGKSGAAITDKNADLNNDGDVNVLDLSILLANFGK